MESIIDNMNVCNDNNLPLPLGWDGLFKKVFGNEDKPQNVEMLLSLIFNIPYEELKNKTQIVNNDNVLLHYDDKKQSQDIVLKVFLHDEGSFVNLEAIIHGFDQDIINRNLSYITYIFSKQLRKKVPYGAMAPVVQINFTRHTKSQKVDNSRIVDTYMLTNQHGEILTEKLQIIDIYIENCYDIWYNGNINKFTSYEQTIIRLGALHCITDKDEFRKCLGEIEMNDDVRRSIQDDFDEYRNDGDLVYTYNREEHLELLRQSYEMRFNKNMKKVDNLFKEIDERFQEIDVKSQELDLKSQELNEKSQELTEKSQELTEKSQEFKYKENQFKEKQISFAKRLLMANYDIHDISELTGLSINCIKSIKIV